jgi:hypothetical protein
MTEYYAATELEAGPLAAVVFLSGLTVEIGSVSASVTEIVPECRAAGPWSCYLRALTIPTFSGVGFPVSDWWPLGARLAVAFAARAERGGRSWLSGGRLN